MLLVFEGLRRRDQPRRAGQERCVAPFPFLFVSFYGSSYFSFLMSVHLFLFRFVSLSLDRAEGLSAAHVGATWLGFGWALRRTRAQAQVWERVRAWLPR